MAVVTGQDDMHPLDEEAAGWLVLLHDDAATDEDRRRFHIWLAADPAHQRAWQEVGRLWDGLDQLGETRAAGVVALAPPARRGFSGWRMPLAAALAVLSIGLGWQMLPTGVLADYRAGIGERELVRLQDGSTVELGTASALDVNFSGDRREVHLLAGEAFFTVSPDPARPFVVRAGGGEVLVRGTAFNVKIGAETRVAVAEHSVEVSAGPMQGVPVTEGEEVRLTTQGVSAAALADLETVQAWRHDRLVFIDTPLDEVIAELGRYRHGHIRLLGGDLGRMRVTAVFDARDPDAALDTIASGLGLRVWRATGLLVGLSKG